ncbi:MAG: T9SS type A sorting domain-containing protein, partial [Flavobacteriales bacterium]
DGSLTGGTPKGIEIFVLNDIADLSAFGVSSVTNGAGSTAGTVEFVFPNVAVTSGTFIYVSSEDTNFNTFFGMMPTYTTGTVGINGDDSIELYENGQIIDVFGDVNKDGSGEVWDHLDGWAYRKSNTGPEGTKFTTTNWTYSGVDGLEGGINNATATKPFPIGTYTNTTASVKNNTIEGFATYPNPVTNNTFTITTNSTDKKEVKIFNVLGKQVFATTFSDAKSTVTIPAISAGLYILKVTEGTKTVTSKLVIK